MDEVLSRVDQRVYFLDQKSKNDLVHTRDQKNDLDEELSRYTEHLDYLKQKLSSTKSELDELRHMINTTVVLLKASASKSSVEKVQKRVDDLRFTKFLLRKELEKMLR